MVVKRGNGDQSHRFGGTWTTAKLQILGGYLGAYSHALKNQPFKTAYIDAFAGTGYRVRRSKRAPEHPLFPLEEERTQELLDGSARVALKTTPPFDRYIFIEKNRRRATALEQLKRDFPDVADAIDVRHGEANHSIRSLCAKDWRRRRAVLFLDPYGMRSSGPRSRPLGGRRQSISGSCSLWVLR